MIGLGGALLGGMEKLSAKAESREGSISSLDRPLNSNVEKEVQEGVENPENGADSLQELDLPISDKMDMEEGSNPDISEKEDGGCSDEGTDAANDAGEPRALTVQERAKIEEDLKWPDTVLDNCKIKENEIIVYPCRNRDMAEKKNSFGIKYERKVVEIRGYKVEVVVPIFPSVFRLKLPETLEMASDREQFKECNKKLYETIRKNPVLRLKFSKEQISQIQEGMKTGKAPSGYVWHHDCQTGSMVLVDKKLHMVSGHTGGKALWGGGEEYRK